MTSTDAERRSADRGRPRGGRHRGGRRAGRASCCPPSGVITERSRLRTYECDGLAHYRVTPALVVIPEDAAPARGRRPGVRRARGAVRRPRLRHRPLRRRAAARRRRPGRHLADARDHLAAPRGPARGRRAGRDQPRRDPRRDAARLLLRARPLEPADLLDRRQRRGELRRRALPEVRLHHQPRARRGLRHRRRRHRARSATRRRTAPATTCSVPSSAPRARWASSPPRPSGWSGCPRRCARSSSASRAPTRPARPPRRSSRPASCRPRSR